MNKANFRFYAELNDFLPQDRKKKEFEHHFEGTPAVKDTIEALGVPHVEVDVILVNGVSVDFSHRLVNGDRVAVYPVFESLDISGLVKLRPRPLRQVLFIADVHLRKLVSYLRLLGFDTMYDNTYDDDQLVSLSKTTGRIILTRDRMLLKHGQVTHGYWVRSTDPVLQAREVLHRFDLRGQVKLFARCPECNGEIVPVSKEEVYHRIPPKTALWLDEYFVCSNCGKLYWKGTHYPRLMERIKAILS
jgi:hypothetical protein